MANKLYEEIYIKNVADAIRLQSHRTSKFTIDNFEKEIKSIPKNTYNINTPRSLGYSNFDNAWEALKKAISYWNAKKSETEVFVYNDGNGALKGDTSADLHDENGNAIIDCSTFMGLVLRGIGYLESPYNNSLETTIDPRTIVCTNDTWAEEYFDLQENRYTNTLVFPTYTHKTNDGYYRILTAADIAQYYDRLGLFWYADEDSATPRVGDLCFFYKENEDGTLTYPTRFHGISHIGIMTDKDYYLNVTDYDASGNLIRTSVTARPPFAYARPHYGALLDGHTNALTVNKVDLIPNVLSGIKQGVSTQNGVTFSVSEKAVTMSGTSSDGMSIDIVSSGCPLYLSVGTYKLSGFVNNSGTNTVSATHSMWGFRVYNAVTGGGITGVTTSSNGANTAERTPCWDVGAGCTFTLSEPTYIYINLWLPGSKDCSTLSGTPVLYKIA